MTALPHDEGPDAQNPSENGEVSVLDLVIILARHKKLILGLPLATMLVAVVLTLLMSNVYTGSARILPPQQNQSTAAALLGQLAGGGSGAAGAILGVRNPADLYAGVLQGRTIADNIIRRFDLQTLYNDSTLVGTRRALRAATSIAAGKEGIITIEVDDKDPKRAADIANAYVEELDRLSQGLAITEAAQRRMFFEKQLKLAKVGLADAEVALRKTQERTGLIKLDDQGRAIIEAVATLRAGIAAKEVQLGAMRSFATESNPDYRLAQQELVELRSQLSKLEHSDVALKGDLFVPTGKVPEAGLEYIRKLRDVKYFEAIFEVLARQYELARAEEARDGAVIQVVDRAVPPDRKSKPQRALIVLVAGLVAGFIAVLAALVLEATEKARRNPAQAERLQALRRLLWRK